MLLSANCKINIGLDITARRADGFHEISTLMYPVRGLADTVELTPVQGPDAVFTATGLPVDCEPERNLCLRAYRLMQREYGIGAVRIHLHKVVPFGAGLGGGSSDAAAVILGLSELFGLGLDAGRMEGLAARLGSDIPFFVRNVPAIATGRGEVLTPYSLDLRGYWLVIVKPPFGVGTAEAYRGVTPHLPARSLADRLAGGVARWRGEVANDFEPTVFAAHPQLAALKEELYNIGAVYASLSGSGSALFGLFDREPGMLDGWGDLFVYQSYIG
ncbi:MAG: 4-(cytidine 5'-diphospho)-2-C-methyl-D-erythritol kinase [Rikenellaceae bacterium]|nr:4-(cytidine 5'-diphospho)-2-C-methyl-D-erythritol kinase [Rikenellaceae bacterium]